MKLRLFRVVAALFIFAGVGHAAVADKGDKGGNASGGGAKNLTIPSVEMGGGALGVSTDKPSAPDVPGFNDPADQNDRVEPFVGLKFNKPLGDR